MGHRTPGLFHLQACVDLSPVSPQPCKLVRLIDQSLYEGGYLISNREESEGGRGVKDKNKKGRDGAAGLPCK